MVGLKREGSGEYIVLYRPDDGFVNSSLKGVFTCQLYLLVGSSAPNKSSKMYIVLYISCNSDPTIDNNMISYEVSKVGNSYNCMHPSLLEV